MALEQLGHGPCMHMVPLLDDPERARLWEKAAHGDLASLDDALEGYRATVDWPGAYFWRVLAERHPAAKIILTVRDEEGWYDSVARTIYPVSQAAPAGPHRDMIEATIWWGTFGDRFADRAEAVRIFREHNDAVRREIDPDRLLEFRVADGWEPLCAFLGSPVPDMPFPRLNDTDAFQQRVRARLSTGGADRGPEPLSTGGAGRGPEPPRLQP